MAKTKKKKKKGAENQLKHKIISVAVAIVLIVIIVIFAFGKKIKTSLDNGEQINARFFLALLYPDKYAYSTEQYDLNEYFGLFSSDEVAIILADNRLEDKGLYKDGTVYFSLETAERLFTDRFYYNSEEDVLLYSTASDIYKVKVSDTAGSYTYGASQTPLSYDPAFVKGESLYLALDYVRMFDDFDYSYYAEPHRVEVYNTWDSYMEAEITHDTSVRYQGGIKSSVLTKIEKGAKVHVLENFENWTRIRTEDGFDGYVEKDKLTEAVETAMTPASGAYNPNEDYSSIKLSETVRLGWHQIYFADDGANLNETLNPEANINVVSPTWFYINSESGSFDSYASSAYVENAHSKGLKVWGLVEDMTNDFDEYVLFSSSSNRKAFIDNLILAVKEVGADGINVDCEKIGSKTGPHFVQFLRELSIETHKNGLVLSVDNYYQNQGNLYYDLREQGLVADYVILMGYDEHWAGGEPGSVASIAFVENGISKALDTGVPADKLVNGIPFFTRIWTTEGSTESSQAVGMDTVKEWLSIRGVTASWNDECCQNYIKYEDGTAVSQIWIEDADSLSAKLSLMNSYNIAGFAGWKLGLENTSAWDTIKQYYGN